MHSQEQEREHDGEVFIVTALSRDEYLTDHPSAQPSALMCSASRGMSPTHRIPGYIPGMQRPMTPHDLFEQFSTISQATKPGVKTITRIIGSPGLSEFPHIENGSSSARGYSPGDKERAGYYEGAPSVISRMDPGSPLPFPRMSRSPTPDSDVPPTTTASGMVNRQGGMGKRAKSPSFSIGWPNVTSAPTMTDQHQKQEPGSFFVSSFEYSPQSPVLTSLPNPSRSSFRSEGSSYHSIGEEDGKKDPVEALFAKIEDQPPEWYDFADVGIDTSHLAGTPEEVSFGSLVKEFVKQLSGLSKGDLVAVQERLLDVIHSRMGGVDGGNIFTRLPPSTMPGSSLPIDQHSAPNLTVSYDEFMKQVLVVADAAVAVQRSLSGSSVPRTAKRKVDRDRTSSPTLGLGQRFRKSSGTLKVEPSPVREDSSHDSSRRPVIRSLLRPPQFLSRL